MSIIEDEVEERYPLSGHGGIVTMSREQWERDLRDAYRAGATRTPSGVELEAAVMVAGVEASRMVVDAMRRALTRDDTTGGTAR